MKGKTFRLTVEVTLNDELLSGSEFSELRKILGTSKGLKETIEHGVYSLTNGDAEFREIDPLSKYSTKIKVTKEK